MLDEHDDLADRLDRLFTAGDPVTARRNFDAARSRSRHGRIGAAASAAAAVLVVGLVGVSTFRDGNDGLQVAVTDANITPLSTLPTEPTPTSVDEAAPAVARGIDVEGRVYAAVRFLAEGGGSVLEFELAGSDNPSLTFFKGQVSGATGGCQYLTGTYAPDESPLVLEDLQQSTLLMDCGDQTSVGERVTRVLSDSTVTLSDSTLIFSSTSAGTLEYVEQPYEPGVWCVPGVDSLHQGEVTGDVAGSGSEPLQAAREQLAVNSETAGLDRGLPFELVMANPDQALVSAGQDGRPVLSVVLKNTSTGWAVSSFAACVPQPGPPVTEG